MVACRSHFLLLNFYALLQMETISGLRYRADDAMRAVSRRAVRLARRKEIEEEILNSEKLKVVSASQICFSKYL